MNEYFKAEKGEPERMMMIKWQFSIDGNIDAKVFERKPLQCAILTNDYTLLLGPTLLLSLVLC